MVLHAMTLKDPLDAKDWQLIEALQRDARLGYAELGRRLGGDEVLLLLSSGPLAGLAASLPAALDERFG